MVRVLRVKRQLELLSSLHVICLTLVSHLLVMLFVQLIDHLEGRQPTVFLSGRLHVADLLRILLERALAENR